MSTSSKSLARSAGVIGAFTALSRVLGFIRDIVIASAFGTGLGAEAFVVCFKIPNLLRDLVGEGATNSAFVPVLTECREKEPEKFWRLASTLFWVMTFVLTALSVLGILLAPQIVSLIAPGFLASDDPYKFLLTVTLTRVIFPYIFLIGLSALAMGILNTLKEFKSSAFGPALLNISLIISGYFFEASFGPMALVVGVLIGGALQLACQLFPLFKSGFRLLPAFGTGNGYAKKIGKLLLPRAFGSALYQVNVFVDSIIASFESFVGPGGQAALYYSNRVFQLPLAIFGISLAQAVLPTFSSQMVKNDIQGFKQTFSGAIRSLMFIAIPASLGLSVLSNAIVRTLFEHGKFNAYSTGITASSLFYYSFGLASCCFIKILVNVFYAMQDTRTPVKTMIFSVGANIILSLCFMGPLKIGGLALASTLSATLNVALLYAKLRSRFGSLDEAVILNSAAKIITASAVMALAAWLFDEYAMPWLGTFPRIWQLAGLCGGIAGCIAVYLFISFLLKVKEMQGFTRGFRS